MTDVPVKLECGCGAKMEFTVALFDVAERWTGKFDETHQVCRLVIRQAMLEQGGRLQGPTGCEVPIPEKDDAPRENAT